MYNFYTVMYDLDFSKGKLHGEGKVYACVYGSPSHAQDFRGI